MPEHSPGYVAAPAVIPNSLPLIADNNVTVRVHATFGTPTSASRNAPATPSRRVPAISNAPLTPSRAPVASTSHPRPMGRGSSVLREDPTPQLELSDDDSESETAGKYWVIIEGKKPGVYKDLYVPFT